MDIINRILLMMTLSNLSKLISTEPLGVCSNTTLGGPLTCCENYRKVDDRCQECVAGTFGTNCNQTCPENFYGRFCNEVCDCKDCDKSFGCQKDTLEQQAVQICIKIIILSTIGNIIICVTCAIFVYCKFWKHNTLNAPEQSQNKVSEFNGENTVNQCLSTSTSNKLGEDIHCPESSAINIQQNGNTFCNQAKQQTAKEQNPLSLCTAEDVYVSLYDETERYNVLSLKHKY
ncbi:uncharacterized protein LOC134236352 [Saccostrea cucullata]|uniref:uncharacterized protein LOC134236352 n=1 Tax=Saccostrea cuccullata TaxID=36930 RepID=UPI002ED2E40C